MPLTPEQFKEIEDALLQAYSEFELRRMVRFGLDENFDGIAGGRNLSEQIFNLILWAERAGRELDLVCSAHEHNPGNRLLQQCYENWMASPPRAPAVIGGTTSTPTPPVTFDWVTIPAGEFLMGSDKQKDSMAYQRETAQHTLYLPAYGIAKTPVTNAQYWRFVQATGHPPPHHWTHGEIPAGKHEHPVVGVTWYDAQAFCVWADVRLPTEAEWEKAARGTYGRVWPWGNDRPNASHCNFNGNVGDTTPVGAYPAALHGLYDMAGNVREWTSSLLRPYPYDAEDGREHPQEVGPRVLRGGSWGDTVEAVRCADRVDIAPDNALTDRGFRVVAR
jgi:formylglycine-generating enzyme required for sulfatase activity